MKRLSKIWVFLLLSLFLVSCQDRSFSISELYAQGYENDSGNACLSLFFETNCKDASSLTMVVTDSTGNLSWEVKVEELVYENVTYYGYSAFAMPLGSVLAPGTWNLKVYDKSGSCVQRDFVISY